MFNNVAHELSTSSCAYARYLEKLGDKTVPKIVHFHVTVSKNLKFMTKHVSVCNTHIICLSPQYRYEYCEYLKCPPLNTCYQMELSKKC